MEAVRETKRPRTVTLSVPSGDYSFLRSMTTRMGWTIIPQPRKRKAEPRYPELDRAIEEVRRGDVRFQGNRHPERQEVNKEIIRHTFNTSKNTQEATPPEM